MHVLVMYTKAPSSRPLRGPCAQALALQILNAFTIVGGVFHFKRLAQKELARNASFRHGSVVGCHRGMGESSLDNDVEHIAVGQEKHVQQVFDDIAVDLVIQVLDV